MFKIAINIIILYKDAKDDLLENTAGERERGGCYIGNLTHYEILLLTNAGL